MDPTVDLHEMLEEVRALTSEVSAATAAQREQRLAERAQHANKDDELAAKRRNGEMGRDWQVLQQRIDMNQTTLDDVLNGVDTSKEARAVRLVIQRDLIPRARQQFAEAMKSEELEVPLQQLHTAQAELQEALASIQRMRGDR